MAEYNLGSDTVKIIVDLLKRELNDLEYNLEPARINFDEVERNSWKYSEKYVQECKTAYGKISEKICVIEDAITSLGE